MANKIETRTPLTYEFEEENGLLVVELKNSLSTEDFATLSQVIDPYYEKHGELRGIIINAKKFPFWQGSQGFKEHVSFVKNHHYKTKKVAIAIGGFFPRILRRLAQRFVKAEVKNFGYNKIEAAAIWILS